MIRRRRLRPVDTERGAAAMLVAISILMLMGFAAIAVDSGIAFDDRRQQQSGADVGALAALQFARTTIPSAEAICNAENGIDYAACRGAEEAIEVINDTVYNRYLPADWTACADPNKPAEYTQVSHLSPCINYTDTLQKVRVRLPTTPVDTSFGALLGVSAIPVSANAEAGADLNQSANILPFALGPTGAASNHACLFANSTSNLDVDPCNGPVEGNFGFLDIALYGNITVGTPQICGNAMPQTKLGTNIVVGTDHPLEEESKTPGSIVNDFANCPILTNPVDQLRTQTGNSTNGLQNGLFYGIATPALEGRLLCKTGGPGENPAAGFMSAGCTNVLGIYPQNLDDSPLWTYITAAAKAQVPAGRCSGVSDRAEMETCLNSWRSWGNPNKPSLFTAGISQSPRFAALPILEDDPSNGSGNYLIIEFIPTYLETLYIKCNAKTCDVVHSPDEPGPIPMTCPNPLTPTDTSCGWPAVGNNGTKITALTSFILTIDMLDPEHQKFFPARPGTIIFNLIK